MTFQKLLLKVSVVALVAFSTVFTSLAVTAASQPRDCDNNAVVYCGAYTKTELNKKISEGDTRNSAANLKQIFFNEGRGITLSGINNAVDGTVFKDGRVVVGGKIVATGAKSVGRQQLSSSTKQGSVWIRPVNVSFKSDSIAAFINMDGGVFRWAILKSCGNFVSAKAVPTPAPTNTPKPSPFITPIPPLTPVITETPTPTPIAQPPLAETGSSGTLGGVMGLGALGYAGHAYLRSKNALNKSQKRK